MLVGRNGILFEQFQIAVYVSLPVVMKVFFHHYKRVKKGKESDN